MRIVRVLMLLALATGLSGATSFEPLAHATGPGPGTEPRLSIVVRKSERKLYLYGGATLLKTYPLALGSHPTGTKRQEGDGATPEGDYYVTHSNARSQYHLSLGLSYPNTSDAKDGLARSLISKAEYDAIASAIDHHERPPQHTRLGGDVFIHGGGISGDWTRGCVALEDKDIEDLFAKVPPRTPVRILP